MATIIVGPVVLTASDLYLASQRCESDYYDRLDNAEAGDPDEQVESHRSLNVAEKLIAAADWLDSHGG